MYKLHGELRRFFYKANVCIGYLFLLCIFFIEIRILWVHMVARIYFLVLLNVASNLKQLVLSGLAYLRKYI